MREDLLLFHGKVRVTITKPKTTIKSFRVQSLLPLRRRVLQYGSRDPTQSIRYQSRSLTIVTQEGDPDLERFVGRKDRSLNSDGSKTSTVLLPCKMTFVQ